MGGARDPGCRKRRVSKMLKFKVIRGLSAIPAPPTTKRETMAWGRIDKAFPGTL